MWLKRLPGLLLSLVLLFTISSCHPNSDVKKDGVHRVNSYISQAVDSAEDNPDFSRNLLKKAMSATIDSLLYYQAMTVFARTYGLEEQTDSSFYYSRNVLSYCNRQAPTAQVNDMMGESYTMSGNYYKEIDSVDTALGLYRKALRCYKRSKRTERLPEIYVRLAEIYSVKGNYATSVNFFRKSLYLSDSLQTTKKMGYPIYFGLAQVYMDLCEYQLCERYFKLAEKYLENQSLSKKFIYCNNRGGFHYDRREFDKALYWSTKAMSLVHDVTLRCCSGVSEVNLADIYLQLGQLDSTRLYLDRSIVFFSKNPCAMADYYIRTIEMGLAIKQNNLSRVRELIREKEDIQYAEWSIVVLRNKQLETYYSKIGDYRNAYLYQSKNQRLNDSILRDRSIKSAAELDVRYKLDTTVIRKDLLILNQNAQLKDLRLTRFVWILVCLLVFTVAFFLYIFMRRQRDLQRLKHMDQVTKLRMQNIRNQISPHFILNILNREIISVEESRRNGLYGLAKMLRESLDMTENTSITLEKELEFVETYIELERCTLGADFELIWEVDSWINLKKTRIPPMLVQIPVENAIKRGLRLQTGKKLLHLHVAQVAKGIMITIQDNGIGYFPGDVGNNRSAGTGMNILYQTIQLLNSKNSEKIVFRISNMDDETKSGARVDLLIPTNYKYD